MSRGKICGSPARVLFRFVSFILRNSVIVYRSSLIAHRVGGGGGGGGGPLPLGGGGGARLLPFCGTALPGGGGIDGLFGGAGIPPEYGGGGGPRDAMGGPPGGWPYAGGGGPEGACP
mmetsp:Transcript_6315/g.15641  ORF Transcript_6315/g.15641 Transcript_6315/m.15641 type:complete len:117 (+) Transcript_6315:1724-2074(+)